MEYCSSGSLLSVLESPEHSFGLPEEEFLVVLRCVGEPPTPNSHRERPQPPAGHRPCPWRQAKSQRGVVFQNKCPNTEEHSEPPRLSIYRPGTGADEWTEPTCPIAAPPQFKTPT